VLKVMRTNLKPEIVEKEVRLLTDLILKNISPLEMYLFGSASEGKMTDQSDYDLLIVVTDQIEQRLGMKKYSEIRSQLPRRPIDTIWMTKSEFDEKKREGGVAFIAFNEGKRLI